MLDAAAQGKYRVRVTHDYFEPVSLWTCTALPSGSRKSAVWAATTAPLSEWERERRAEVEPIIRRIESERKTIEMRIESLRREAAKPTCKTVHELNQEIQALEHDMPDVPRLPQVWCGDITPEALPVIMAENGERMALLSDEGGIFDTLAGRYSNGVPNLDVYLQGHAGSAVRVNRASRAAVFLERPALTIGITPQPDVVRALADKPGFKGRGLLARFLYALPANTLGRRTLQAVPMPDDVREAYTATVRAILDSPWSQDDQGRDCAHVLKLSTEAMNMRAGFERKVEPMLGEGGTLAHIGEWGAKLVGAVVRIAAVFHVARHAHGEPWAEYIGAVDFAAAVRLGDVLTKHALIAFDCMGADPALDDARTILGWLRREGKTTFTRRDCQAVHKHRFHRADDVNAPLDVLLERGYIRPRSRAVAASVGRPPSQAFDVNPLWTVNPC